MKVIVTGGGGFLGNQLVRALCARKKLNLKPNGEVPVTSIDIVDIKITEAGRTGLPGMVRFFETDISKPEAVKQVIPTGDPFLLYHLAAIVSGDGERDFDLCMRVNLDGTRMLFEACRHHPGMPRVVFASTLAVFGGKNCPPVIGDEIKQLPQTTYGMTKLMGELMINDYSRRGFFDGRAVRLPTIFIRPGGPNAALSSFASGLFREPLNGERFELPVDRDQGVSLLGYRRAVDAFIKTMECEADFFEDDRTLTLPSRQYVVQEMIDVLRRKADEKGIRLGEIVDIYDPLVRKVVKGWPVGTEAARAEQIGIKADAGVEEVIDQYIEDFL